jgi:small subunit ribosomal protein S4e
MAKMGKSYQMKRIASPWFYPLLRKEYKWSVKPIPGPHSIRKSIPLAILLRDVLKIADNLREAKAIINSRKVLIDGSVITEYRFPVGLMDVIYIKEAEQYFRLIPHNTEFLFPVKISENESTIKPIRIIGKTTQKRGNIQLNLEDGKNILIKVEDPKAKQPLVKVGSTILLDLKKKEIINSFNVEEGSYVIAMGGRHVGEHGVIKKIREVNFKKAKYSTVIAEKSNGEAFETNIANIMAIGKEKPYITLS